MTLNCFILFFLSFGLTVVLTPPIRRLLQRFGFWNAKDKEHKNRVVRGGGIAVILSFLISLFITGLWEQRISIFLMSFLCPVLILMATGIADDRFSLKPLPKLFLQILPFVILWFSGFRIEVFMDWTIPSILSLCLTVFWGVSILNAFNLIDGLDGLCSGTALIASFAFLICGILSGNVLVTVVSLAVIGSCGGFLVYNYHPAKLFLGDTGSLFMGLACAVMSLSLARGNFSICVSHVLVLIFWIPFCDLGLAVWRRRVKAWLRGSKKGVMERDLYHIHYRLLKVVKDHRMTVHILWFFMFLNDLIAIFLFYSDSNLLTLAIFVLISVISLISLAQYEIQYTNCLFKHLLRKLWKEILKMDDGKAYSLKQAHFNQQQSTNGVEK